MKTKLSTIEELTPCETGLHRLLEALPDGAVEVPLSIADEIPIRDTLWFLGEANCKLICVQFARWCAESAKKHSIQAAAHTNTNDVHAATYAAHAAAYAAAAEADAHAAAYATDAAHAAAAATYAAAAAAAAAADMDAASAKELKLQRDKLKSLITENSGLLAEYLL